MKNNDENNKEFYLGRKAVFIPIIFLIISIITLVILKRASLKTFWIIGLFAIFLMYLLSKNKKDFGSKCVENLKSNTLLTCILVFILAGILSSILKVTGVSKALLIVFINIGVGPEFVPAIMFIICCVISTFIGTNTGTYSIVVPIFLPIAVSLNCNPALALGAIMCGGGFGDNLSPISDTTIISVNTLKVNLLDTLKARIKVSLGCAFVSTIIFIILGHLMITNPTENLTEYPGDSLIPLLMLFVFVLMIILLIKKKDLISVLLICDVVAIVLAMLLGIVSFGDMFSANSPIISGIEGVFGVIVFWILLFILTEFIPKDFLEEYIDKKVKNSKSESKTNGFVALSIVTSVLIISNNTASMSLIGKYIDRCFRNKTQIEKANIFDGLSCATSTLIPYNTAVMLMITLAYGTGCLPENFSVLSIVMFSINSMLLLITYMFKAIYTPRRKLKKA